MFYTNIISETNIILNTGSLEKITCLCRIQNVGQGQGFLAEIYIISGLDTNGCPIARSNQFQVEASKKLQTVRFNLQRLKFQRLSQQTTHVGGKSGN